MQDSFEQHIIMFEWKDIGSKEPKVHLNVLYTFEWIKHKF